MLVGGDVEGDVNEPSSKLLEQRDAGHQEPQLLVERPRLEFGLIDIKDGAVNFATLGSVQCVDCIYRLLLRVVT